MEGFSVNLQTMNRTKFKKQPLIFYKQKFKSNFNPIYARPYLAIAGPAWTVERENKRKR